MIVSGIMARAQVVVPAGSLPKDIASCTTWWDFTDPTKLWKTKTGAAAPTDPVTADDDIVQCIVAKLGAAQSRDNYYSYSASNHPRYRTNVINGKAVARFNGTDQSVSGIVYSLADWSGETTGVWTDQFTASAKSIICAVYPTAAHTVNDNYGNRPAVSDNGNRWELGFNSNGLSGSDANARLYNYDGSEDKADVLSALNQWMIISVTHNGTTMRVRVNRGAWTNQASGSTASPPSQMYIGVNSFTSSRFQGDMAHVALFNAALADADVDAVEDYFAAQLGLTLP